MTPANVTIVVLLTGLRCLELLDERLAVEEEFLPHRLVKLLLKVLKILCVIAIVSLVAEEWRVIGYAVSATEFRQDCLHFLIRHELVEILVLLDTLLFSTTTTPSPTSALACAYGITILANHEGAKMPDAGIVFMEMGREAVDLHEQVAHVFALNQLDIVVCHQVEKHGQVIAHLVV